jgi:predicted HicB family RNase H-like nuclease
MKVSDNYIKIVEWSEEDQSYVGSCPALMLGGVHGDDETKVYKELCAVVEEWIAQYQKDGDPLPAPTSGKTFSGKFVLRIEPELHRTLYMESLRYGESLNTLCVHLLKDYTTSATLGIKKRRTTGFTQRAHARG